MMVVALRTALLAAVLIALPASAQSNVRLTFDPTDSAGSGRLVALIAQVSPVTTGRVTFYDGTVILGTATVKDGFAFFYTKLLAPGKHVFLARYIKGPGLPATQSVAVPYTVTPVRAYGLRPAPDRPANGQYPVPIAAADLNGDGALDFVVGSANDAPVNGLLSVLLGNPRGEFRPITTPTSDLQTPVDLAIGDLNGDGFPDLVYITTTLNVKLGNGQGGFNPIGTTVDLPGASGLPYRVAIADFNLDGIPDIVVARVGTNDVTVLLGDGSGKFKAQDPLRLPIVNRPSIAVADFDGDGNPDVAVAVVVDKQTAGVLVAFGDGQGTFSGTRSFSAILSIRPDAKLDLGDVSVIATDCNGDGLPDLAIAAVDVWVLLGNGDGTFEAMPGSPFPNLTGGVSEAVAASDLDGDGQTDLAVAVAGRSRSVVLYGRGNTFAPAQSLFDAGSAEFSPYSLAVGDFNGDGRPDVVFPSRGGLLVFLGNGPLQLEQARPLPFTVGQTASIRLTVSNRSSSTVSGSPVVFDALPAGLEAVGVSADGWDCTFDTRSVTCSRSGPVQPNEVLPPIEISVRVSAAACRPVSAMVVNLANRADLFIVNETSSETSYTSLDTPTDSISGCFKVSSTVPGALVVNASGAYAVVNVALAQGAQVPEGYPIEVRINAPGVSPDVRNDGGAEGDGWSCRGAGNSVVCTRDASVGGPDYPAITATGFVNPSACPTMIQSASLFGSGTLQAIANARSDLYGCINVPSDIDLGAVPFATGDLSAYSRVLTVVSTDKHPVQVSLEGYPAFAPSQYDEYWCQSAGNYITFGRACIFSVLPLACSIANAGRFVIHAKAGDAPSANYSVGVRIQPYLAGLTLSLEGAANGVVEPAKPARVGATILLPGSPQSTCPETSYRVGYDFAFTRLQELRPDAYDATFDRTSNTLNPGTVAGQIRLAANINGRTVTTQSGSTSLTVAVPLIPPVVEAVSVDTQSNSLVQLSVTAFSTPRETSDTEVCLQFLPAPGAVIEPQSQFCGMKEDIRIWYERPASLPAGSRFKLPITAGFAGDKAAIGAVKVVVKNVKGESAPYCVDLTTKSKRDCP